MGLKETGYRTVAVILGHRQPTMVGRTMLCLQSAISQRRHMTVHTPPMDNSRSHLRRAALLVPFLQVQQARGEQDISETLIRDRRLIRFLGLQFNFHRFHFHFFGHIVYVSLPVARYCKRDQFQCCTKPGRYSIFRSVDTPQDRDRCLLRCLWRIPYIAWSLLFAQPPQTLRG